MNRGVGLIPILLAVISITGCATAGEGSAELRVGGATSLKGALTEYATETGRPMRLSSASSDEVAAQIRSGADLDVFVSVDPDIIGELEAGGLVSDFGEVAANEVVFAVRSDSGIGSIRWLSDGSFALGTGTPGTPFGRYAEELFDRMPRRLAGALRESVRTREPNLTSLIGKLRQRGIDGAIVYRSDVEASGGLLRALTTPVGVERLRVPVIGSRVVGTENAAAAERYLKGLRGPIGQSIFRRFGFEPIRGNR